MAILAYTTVVTGGTNEINPSLMVDYTGSTGTNEWANCFTPETGDWLVTSVDIRVSKAGSGATGTPIEVTLYNTDSNYLPTTVLATSITNITASDLTTATVNVNNAEWHNFEFDAITLTQGSTYAIGIRNLDAYPWNGQYLVIFVFTVAGSNHTPNYFFRGAEYKIPAGAWSLRAGGSISFHYKVNGTIIVPVPPGTPDDLTPFPPSCCSNTENDYYWQPGVWNGDVYTDPSWGSGYVATGGGRWGRNLVVAGHGLVYYEDYT